ncbi:MAG: conjugal transfer protein [Dorea sp.]|jgi:hypothetical protein|nr:conjugal transfer protein [Dorea sp.]MCI9272269.1 conjugal transfer protein [Dorea sp.]
METTKWRLCPVCDRKTHNKIREDTEAKNFPLYCPKCKRETVIDVKNFVVSVCKCSIQ